MKIRKIILLFLITIGLISIINSSCKKDDTPEIYVSHVFYDAYIEIGGSIVDDIELHEDGYYNYEEGKSLSFSVVRNGEVKYSFIVNINISEINDSTVVNLPMIFNCDIIDPDAPGYVELIVEGDQNEKYISQSGIIEVMRMNQNLFVAYFDILLMGKNNGGNVTLVGNLEYMFLP